MNLNPLKFLDGYKTSIGVIVWGVVLLLRDFDVEFAVQNGDAMLEWVKWWTGVGIAHKGAKILSK